VRFDKSFLLIFRRSENEGGERYRRAALTSVFNIASQFLQLATGLISVPLTLNYIGVERFGLWMALSSSLTLLAFSDFGLGIGLQDKLSKSIAVGNKKLAIEFFYTAASFAAILFLLLLLSLLLIPLLNIKNLLSLQTQEAVAEIVPTTQMVVLVIGIGILAGIVQRTFNSLQDGFWIAILQIAARISSLGLLFVAVHFKWGLPALVLIVGGLSSLAIIFFGPVILFRAHPWLFVSKAYKLINSAALLEILKVGSAGLLASVAIYLVNNSIFALISMKYGVAAVTQYSVLNKLLTIPTFFLTYLFLPLWPAISEAKAKNDVAWILSLHLKILKTTLFFSVFTSTLFLIFGKEVVFVWTRNQAVVPDFDLLFASVFFMAIGFWNSLYSTILNGLSRFNGQASYGVLIAISFCLLAWLVPREYSVASIVWVVGGGYALRCVLMWLETRQQLKKLGSSVKHERNI